MSQSCPEGVLPCPGVLSETVAFMCSYFEEDRVGLGGLDSCVAVQMKRSFQKWCKEYHFRGKRDKVTANVTIRHRNESRSR